MQEMWKIYHHEIPEFLREFAQTPPVQRLKDVGMNCGCEYTAFPLFANLRPYSRFDHSMGVALIVWHFTASMEQALAGLFHDVTTPVFAHVVDFLNGDHLRQESTEAGVAECITSSPEVCDLLRRYGIVPEAIADYHSYPVADKDAPALAADRLEYTLVNLWNYGYADLSWIRAAYEDLMMGTDETGRAELVFRTAETAALFAEMALKTAGVYIADEDRFAMQALADLLRRAVERGVIRYEDLWTTERAVLARLKADPVSGAEWRVFSRYCRVLRRPDRPEDGYWVRVGAKRRWIDPYAAELGRVSCWNPKVAAGIEALKSTSFDLWLSALS